MPRQNPSKRAFTLTELLIVIGILGLAFDFGFNAIYRWSFPYMARRGRR